LGFSKGGTPKPFNVACFFDSLIVSVIL